MHWLRSLTIPSPLYDYFIRVAAFICNKGQVFNHPLYKSLADIPLPGQDAKVRKGEAASSVDIVNRTQEGNVTNTKPRLLEAGIKEGVYITLKRKKNRPPRRLRGIGGNQSAPSRPSDRGDRNFHLRRGAK